MKLINWKASHHRLIKSWGFFECLVLFKVSELLNWGILQDGLLGRKRIFLIVLNLFKCKLKNFSQVALTLFEDKNLRTRHAYIRNLINKFSGPLCARLLCGSLLKTGN